MNPMNIMMLKNLMEKFKQNHLKVPMFFESAAQCVGENSVIEIGVTTAEGKNLFTNLKVTKEDLDLIQQLKILSQQK